MIVTSSQWRHIIYLPYVNFPVVHKSIYGEGLWWMPHMSHSERRNRSTAQWLWYVYVCVGGLGVCGCVCGCVWVCMLCVCVCVWVCGCVCCVCACVCVCVCVCVWCGSYTFTENKRKFDPSRSRSFGHINQDHTNFDVSPNSIDKIQGFVGYDTVEVWKFWSWNIDELNFID